MDQSHLGKTFFGKIIQGAGDVVHGIANTVVSPLETVIGKEIVGNNYSNTGFGNFIQGSQNADSKLNSIIGGALSSIFLGGAVKVTDVDKAELQKKLPALIDKLNSQMNLSDQQKANAQAIMQRVLHSGILEQHLGQKIGRSTLKRKMYLK
jgi:hypothetical protein